VARPLEVLLVSEAQTIQDDAPDAHFCFALTEAALNDIEALLQLAKDFGDVQAMTLNLPPSVKVWLHLEAATYGGGEPVAGNHGNWIEVRDAAHSTGHRLGAEGNIPASLRLHLNEANRHPRTFSFVADTEGKYGLRLHYNSPARHASQMRLHLPASLPAAP
jgi:hypothetical protein